MNLMNGMRYTHVTIEYIIHILPMPYIMGHATVHKTDVLDNSQFNLIELWLTHEVHIYTKVEVN